MPMKKSQKDLVRSFSGLLSNQGEKSIDFYFIMVPSKEKSIKVWYSKAQFLEQGRL